MADKASILELMVAVTTAGEQGYLEKEEVKAAIRRLLKREGLLS